MAIIADSDSFEAVFAGLVSKQILIEKRRPGTPENRYGLLFHIMPFPWSLPELLWRCTSLSDHD